MAASDRDALRFQYIHTRANELRTTLELGGRLAGRGGAIGGALTIPVNLRDPHLADEIYGDWTHTFNPAVSATLWLSVAFPGAGLRSIPFARTETWIGLGGSISVSIARKKSTT